MACHTTLSAPRTCLAAALCALCGCDPMYEVDVSILVPEEVLADYSEVDRGVLVSDFDGSSGERWIVCGGTEPIMTRAGVGDLGCPKRIDVIAFIAPLAADDERVCGPIEEVAEYDGPPPPAQWPQASTVIAHRRGVCKIEGPEPLLVLE